MSPIRPSKCSVALSKSTFYARSERHTKKPTTTTHPGSPSVLPLDFTELTDYFTSSNDQLYNLLNGNSELHRIVYGLETLYKANCALEEIRVQQELYLYSQYRLAMQLGLQQRIEPLVKAKHLCKPSTDLIDRTGRDDSIPSYDTDDRKYLAHNEDVVNEWAAAIETSDQTTPWVESQPTVNLPSKEETTWDNDGNIIYTWVRRWQQPSKKRRTLTRSWCLNNVWCLL